VVSKAAALNDMC